MLFALELASLSFRSILGISETVGVKRLVMTRSEPCTSMLCTSKSVRSPPDLCQVSEAAVQNMSHVMLRVLKCPHWCSGESALYASKYIFWTSVVVAKRQCPVILCILSPATMCGYAGICSLPASQAFFNLLHTDARDGEGREKKCMSKELQACSFMLPSPHAIQIRETEQNAAEHPLISRNSQLQNHAHAE